MDNKEGVLNLLAQLWSDHVQALGATQALDCLSEGGNADGKTAVGSNPDGYG